MGRNEASFCSSGLDLYLYFVKIKDSSRRRLIVFDFLWQLKSILSVSKLKFEFFSRIFTLKIFKPKVDLPYDGVSFLGSSPQIRSWYYETRLRFRSNSIPSMSIFISFLADFYSNCGFYCFGDLGLIARSIWKSVSNSTLEIFTNNLLRPSKRAFDLSLTLRFCISKTDVDVVTVRRGRSLSIRVMIL